MVYLCDDAAIWSAAYLIHDNLDLGGLYRGDRLLSSTNSWSVGWLKDETDEYYVVISR